MKKILCACVLIIALAFPALAGAKVNWKKLELETASVPTGEEVSVRYLTGLPDIDAKTPCYSYSVKLAFDADALVLKRRMIDQSKGKGLTDVEVARMKYADIEDVLFGYDAIYALQEGELPTAQRTICGNMKLIVLMQRMKSPVAILLKQGGRKVSLVVSASNRNALELYRGIGEHAKVKLLTPLAYKGIVKERAKLEPPPPESER